MKFFRPGADLRYLGYLAKHKTYIVSPGRKLGLPYSQLLLHDIYKFTPTEWVPYRNFFFPPDNKRTPEIRKAFREAVKHHYAHSPHHRANPNFNKDFYNKIEAVVDWYASAKAQSPHPSQFPSFDEWYLGHRQQTIDLLGPAVDSYIMANLHVL